MNFNINNQEEKLPVHLSIDDDLESVGYYEGETERTTIDSEWTESELEDNVYDEVVKELSKVNKSESSKYKAVFNKELTFPEFVVNKIKEENDLIFVYNSLYDEHLNDTEKIFTIHHFDNWIHMRVRDIIKSNYVAK